MSGDDAGYDDYDFEAEDDDDDFFLDDGEDDE